MQTTLSSTLKVQGPFVAEHFTQLAARWICAEDQPFTAVESPSLQLMFTYANPAAKLPSADVVRRVVEDLYGRLKVIVEEFLRVSQDFVPL